MTDAETSLRALLRSVAREHGYSDGDIDITHITSGGANYTSALFLATFASPGLSDLKLFAKVACIGDKMRARMNADTLFKTEQTFYNKLVKLWAGFEEKYQVPEQHRMVFPKFYGGTAEKGKETVVLENLVAAGYGSYSRFKSVDWDHASKAVEVLAKFHALSFVYAKEEPEGFEAMAKELKFAMHNDDDPMLKDLWSRMVEGAVAVLDESCKERVRSFFESRDPRQLFLQYNSPTSAPILVHGDYRPSNLLFKKQDGAVEPVALDFQTLRTGRPVSDLIYFVFMGSDEAFRRDHYHQLVEHYYLQLGLALARYSLDVVDLYPREQFDEDLKEMLPYALLLGVVILPVVTVEAESAPRIDGDADIGDFAVPPNQLFAERFSGLVKDLMRWGAI